LSHSHKTLKFYRCNNSLSIYTTGGKSLSTYFTNFQEPLPLRNPLAAGFKQRNARALNVILGGISRVYLPSPPGTGGEGGLCMKWWLFIALGNQIGNSLGPRL
jgi:hypothetical protein